MIWKMLWVVGLSLHQVPFETEVLCEAAKNELVISHGVKPDSLACVQVASSIEVHK